MRMLANELYGLRDNIRTQGIVFAYSGYVTESVLSVDGAVLKDQV